MTREWFVRNIWHSYTMTTNPENFASIFACSIFSLLCRFIEKYTIYKLICKCVIIIIFIHNVRYKYFKHHSNECHLLYIEINLLFDNLISEYELWHVNNVHSHYQNPLTMQLKFICLIDKLYCVAMHFHLLMNRDESFYNRFVC